MSSDRFEFEHALEIYMVQRRPGFGQLLANDGYQGVLAIDPWDGQIIQRWPFPEGYRRKGQLYYWCLRADGRLAMVFNDDEQTAALLGLDGSPTVDIERPSWTSTEAMPYDWRGEDLWVNDPDRYHFGVFRGTDLSTFEASDGFQALQVNRSWRRAIDRMRRFHGYCMRVEPDRGRMLWFAPGDEDYPARAIGLVSWVDEPDVSVPVVKTPSRMAMVEDRFVAMYEYEAVVLATDGSIVERHVPPPMHHYVAVEGLPARDGRPAAIVLVAAAYDGRLLTNFRVIPIET